MSHPRPATVAPNNGTPHFRGARAYLAGFLAVFFAASLAQCPSRAAQTAPPVGSQSGTVIQYLDQVIDWYGEIPLQQEIATDPNSMMVAIDNRQIAEEVVRLAFEFARAQAQPSSKAAAPNASTSSSPGATEYEGLLRWSATVDQQIKDTQTSLDSLKRKIDTSAGAKRRALLSQESELESELQLANARHDAVQAMLDFVTSTANGGPGATGLRAEIEALARTLPAGLTKSAPGGVNNAQKDAPFTASLSAGATNSSPTGLWGLSADLYKLYGSIGTLNSSIRKTDNLSNATEKLRAPLVNDLRTFAQQGDTLAKQADAASPSELAQEKKQLDDLTAQFKKSTASVLPLSKQAVLLDFYKRNLLNWQAAVRLKAKAEWKRLLIHVIFLAILVGVVIALAEVARRSIQRYVQDAHRRHQFMAIRRVLLWFLVCIVVAISFASDLGSVATFAGLLTAGVAVALQSVILSIAGYFFLIGRYGVRVGDRVEIAGVPGKVVDIGLVRLHLMELTSNGAETPTGRVVAFANSIVFQASAGVFKQIPGTNFIWREAIVTLRPGSNYAAAEERLQKAVEGVFANYTKELDIQFRQMEKSIASPSVSSLRPRVHLRLAPNGLEASVRFPVTLQKAAEMEERVTRELLQAIDADPKLWPSGSNTPTVQIKPDVAPPSEPKK